MHENILAAELLKDLGLKRPPSQTGLTWQSDDQRAAVSEERLELLDADVILAFDFDEDMSEYMDKLEASPLFQRLEGVRNGNFVRLGAEDANALYLPSISAVPVGLEVLEREIVALDPQPKER